MKIIKEHIEYLKDNPEGYWFKSKLYGYGWTPAKPAGWMVIVVYFLFLVGAVWHGETNGWIEESPIFFLEIVFGATLLLILICWKTGEPIKWQWGKKK